MQESHDLDIPAFLRRTGSEPKRAAAAAIKMVQERKSRPANWYMLTKAEQDGTADPVTIALRKQMEQDKKEKQAERFAKLRELAEQRKPSKPKTEPTGEPTRYGVITEGGDVLFSFDAADSSEARSIMSAFRARGDLKGKTVKSLRRLRPFDRAAGGGAIPHNEKP